MGRKCSCLDVLFWGYMIDVSCCRLCWVVALQLAVMVLHYWLEHLASLPHVLHSFTIDVLGFSIWHVVSFQMDNKELGVGVNQSNEHV